MSISVPQNGGISEENRAVCSYLIRQLRGQQLVVSWNCRCHVSEYQFLKEQPRTVCIITSGDCVYKIDYNKVLEYHIEKKADITVVCKDMAPDVDVAALVWYA